MLTQCVGFTHIFDCKGILRPRKADRQSFVRAFLLSKGQRRLSKILKRVGVNNFFSFFMLHFIRIIQKRRSSAPEPGNRKPVEKRGNRSKTFRCFYRRGVYSFVVMHYRQNLFHSRCQGAGRQPADVCHYYACNFDSGKSESCARNDTGTAKNGGNQFSAGNLLVDAQ